MERQSRRHTILQRIVESYIENAQPVSSTMVATRHPNVKLSPASVRAAMAELTREGLLAKPHQSAGRIPTERGLRAYLNQLVNVKLRPWDRTRLEATAQTGAADTFVAQLGQTLSALSGQMAVVAVPQFLGTSLREIGLVRVDARHILAYFVSAGGLVQQKMISQAQDIDPEELQAIQNFLNGRLRQGTLAEVRSFLQAELHEAQGSHDSLRARAARIGAFVLPRPAVKVVVQGTAKLLEQPEFADLKTLRALMRTIEEKQRMLHLLEGLLAGGGVQVMLGSEHALRELDEVACVGCVWTSPSGERAAVSLWGPSRMDYGRLMPLVSHASKVLGQFWEQL